MTPSEELIMGALPQDVVERLADLWCDALLANLRRHPIVPPSKGAQ
jgi:hypothetical protein